MEAIATLFDESEPFLSPGHPVRVFNISLAGIGFHMDHALPADSTHRVHLITRILHLNSRIRVTRCQEHAGQFDVGAEFVED